MAKGNIEVEGKQKSLFARTSDKCTAIYFPTQKYKKKLRKKKN